MLRKIIALACFALLGQPASAAKLYISEYSSLTIASAIPAQVGFEPDVTDQAVDYSGGVAASSAFNNATAYIRVLCDTQCSVKFGATPIATTSSKLLPALIPEYFGVVPGQKISVISNP